MLARRRQDLSGGACERAGAGSQASDFSASLAGTASLV